MFTGIVEGIGRVLRVNEQHGGRFLTIAPLLPFDDLKVGDSIAVNGVCLTITAVFAHEFDATVVPETMRLTNLANIACNDTVNLERPMAINSRFGGHYVQGHIDGMGSIIDMQPDGDAQLVTISLSPALSRYVVDKGYIALDGMSITVVEAAINWFKVTFIPHTQKVTIISAYRTGTLINIEVDLFAKYVEKLIGDRHVITHRTSSISNQ